MFFLESAPLKKLHEDVGGMESLLTFSKQGSLERISKDKYHYR